MIDISKFSAQEIDRIIEMAWEDRTTFDAIEVQFGLKHQEVITLMRKQMKESSFKMWRKRMTNKSTKHAVLRSQVSTRFKCDRQRAISNNKITKR
ncbi:TIGR03643 family protein [Pedobacter sp. Leaf170]|uniref:TIGR03643 family protein n=1 Tax=Pedobacter sp. Leaf170 TaxID=2876558 RepID=UPI001E2A1958|nr:TIGR03643 family protein [Pedobacter sp. Leaf170]